MENKFFTFFASYLSAIDDAKIFRKPFKWLYSLIAIINLLLPLYFLYQAIDNQIFSLGSKFIFGFILQWMTIAIACWIGFQIWWNRKNKISLLSSTGDDFILTPIISHFIQTLGEWIGTLTGLIGFVLGILSIFALDDIVYYFFGHWVIGFINIEGILSFILDLMFFIHIRIFIQMRVLSIILAPIYGFLIIILTRFLAEQIRVLVAIANNTRKK